VPAATHPRRTRTLQLRHAPVWLLPAADWRGGAECRDGSLLFQFAARGDDAVSAVRLQEQLRARGSALDVASSSVASASVDDSRLRPTSAPTALAALHFVGIGGVGLSALARLALADVRFPAPFPGRSTTLPVVAAWALCEAHGHSSDPPQHSTGPSTHPLPPPQPHRVPAGLPFPQRRRHGGNCSSSIAAGKL
jgi:hypothetical protein